MKKPCINIKTTKEKSNPLPSLILHLGTTQQKSLPNLFRAI